MKWIIRIAIAAVVLIAAVVVIGFWQVDRIATSAVKQGTAYATQCEVELDSVDVSVFAGKAEIKNLDIKNPTEFRKIHDSFLKVGTGNAEVSLGSLRSELVEIPEVVLDGVEISLVGRDGETNYQTVLDSLARLKKEDVPGAEEEPGKQYVIRTVRIPPAKVFVDMDEDPALGLAPVKLELTLKEMVFTDVGSGGVPFSQISAELIADILVQVVAQLGEQLGNRVLSGLTSGLNEIMGGTGELQSRITKIAEDLNIGSTVDVAEQLQVAERLGTALESIRDSAGNLDGARDRVRDLIPGGNSQDDDKQETDKDEESSGGIGDRIRGLGR